MTDSSQSSTDLENFSQKLDDIDAELEIQSDYLGKIKLLLTLLVILVIPIVLFVIYIFYRMMNPVYIL